MSEGSDYKTADLKLLLLCLIDKMEIPLSTSQISKFILEGDYMDYFLLQQNLSEMVLEGYLEKKMENNSTRYCLTEEGVTTLEYFEKHIPAQTRALINKYAQDNIRDAKREYDITANYFYEHDNNDITVKCGVYEDEIMLMEINVSVVTREQAKLICDNWKSNVNKLYGSILKELITSPQNSDGDES